MLIRFTTTRLAHFRRVRVLFWLASLLTAFNALPSLASPIVNVDHIYIAKDASQSATITVSDAGDAMAQDIEGMTFTLQIGVGTGSAPSISSIDFLTSSIWTGHVSPSNIFVAAGGTDPQFKSFTLITNTDGDYVAANGTLASVLFSSTGATPGDYALKLIGTKDPGSDTQFTNGLGSSVTSTITNGTLTVVTRGDFNRDNQLTSADIPAMLSALTDLAAYQTSYNLPLAGLVAIGDLTGDGKVTNSDIQPLLDLVIAGGGSINAVPEPAGWLLAAAAILFVAMMRKAFRSFNRLQSAAWRTLRVHE